MRNAQCLRSNKARARTASCDNGCDNGCDKGLEFGRSGAPVYAAVREPALKSARRWAELRLEWSRLNCTTKCPVGGDASACGPELALSPRLLQGVQYYHTRTG